MADVKTALAYLSDLGQRVKALDERISLNQRADSALASNLGVIADRLSRAQDRATVREYRDFAAGRAHEAAEARDRARRDAEACRKWQAVYSDSFVGRRPLRGRLCACGAGVRNRRRR
jgi:hypothetical protein